MPVSVLAGQFGIVHSARLTGWGDGASDGIVAVKTLKGRAHDVANPYTH